MKLAALLPILLSLSTVHAGDSHVRAKLVSDHQTATKGEPFALGIQMDMADHWHTYWENPGSSGLPTSVNWDPMPGLEIGDLQFPIPEKFVDEAGFVTYGYDDSALIIAQATYTGDADHIQVKGEVSWLECKEICIPGSQKVSLELDIGDARPSPKRAQFVAARKTIPSDFDQDAPFTYASRTQFNGTTWRGKIVVTPKGDGTLLQPDASYTFFPGLNPHGELKSSTFNVRDDQLEVDLSYEAWEESVADDLKLDGVLVFKSESGSQSYRLPLVPDVGSLDAATIQSSTKSSKGILLIIVFALIGGLILNAMPCVLPVLSLKVMSIIGDAGESSARRLAMGLTYTFGIMLSFLVLSVIIIATKAAGSGAGIGFQFQNPGFVVFMIILLFAMALMFFDVFSLSPPGLDGMSKLTRKQGYSGAFFNGILMTLLSTPCTAPFLGLVYGWALSAETWAMITVFQFVALGLALPYLVLIMAPGLINRLPKPGPWMQTFKVAMGFPLLATDVWLLWVLSSLKSSSFVIAVLAFLVFFATALWIIGLTWHGKSRLRGALLAIGVTAAGAFVAAWATAPSTIPWREYDQSLLASLRQDNELVFLDFTAEWCLTCKANEKLVIDTHKVRQAFERAGVVPVRVDYTNYDNEIAEMLRSFDRAGVPLYVLYPGGGEPIVLPEVITKSMVIDAVDRASTTRQQRATL